MASESLCDPCLEGNESKAAQKYCSECRETLCEECANFHIRFKAFKGHHLIDLKFKDLKLLSSSFFYCETHPDFKLKLFCKLHDTMCCFACVPDTHKKCTDVVPIKAVSRDIKTSSLLSDSLEIFNDLTKAIDNLIKDRETNRKLLNQTKQLIMEQIRDVKAKLLEEIDKLEENLAVDLNSIYNRNEKNISSCVEALSVLDGTINEQKEQLEFLRDHVSEEHVFIALRHIIKKTKESNRHLQDIACHMKEVNIKFEKTKPIRIKSLGSIVEVTQPSNVEYNANQSKLAQVHDRKFTEFNLQGMLEMQSGIEYDIKGLAVDDDVLVLCNFHSNYPNIYIYKDLKMLTHTIKCSSMPYDIAIIPNSDKAVISLPDEKSIQFIDTRRCILGHKTKVDIYCRGISASKDQIFVGGQGGVIVLKHDSSKIQNMKTITISEDKDFIYSLCFNLQLLLRCSNFLQCVTLEGEKVYRYDISGYKGLAVDKNENAYISGFHTNDIHRLTPDGLFQSVVLNQGSIGPSELTFNIDFTKLFVVSGDGKSLSVYGVNDLHR